MPLPAIVAGLGATFSLSTMWKATVIWLVANVFCRLIFRALFSLGIGVIAYGGVELILDEVIDQIEGGLSGLSGQLEAVLNKANVAEGLGIIFSAASFSITTKLARGFIGFRGQPDQQRW